MAAAAPTATAAAVASGNVSAPFLGGKNIHTGGQITGDKANWTEFTCLESDSLTRVQSSNPRG